MGVEVDLWINTLNCDSFAPEGTNHVPRGNLHLGKGEFLVRHSLISSCDVSGDEQMSTLRINLLGVFRISHDLHPVEINVGRALKGMLAYLVLFSGRIHAREVLAGLFWGDSTENHARSCLSTTLWRLRKILEPDGIPKGTYLLTPPTGEVGFNPESNHWLDVTELESHAQPILAKPYEALATHEVREMEKALDLYSGDLLEGFYEDWALTERERLRSLYIKSQAHLLGYYGQNGGYDKALACGHCILNLDPLREEIHREMMRLYVDCGRRIQAIQQYDKCCRILDAELGVPPMEETQALHARILEGNAREQVQSHSSESLSPAHQALKQINKALQGFDEAAGELRQAGDLLKEHLDD
jgi:DNA-binding SARP family transcriptional activator